MSENRVEKLSTTHRIDSFDCLQPDLNAWLKKHALQAQRANSSQTYVGINQDEVVGYYSLAVGHVEHVDAPSRLLKGQARHPVPIMLLARLAVDVRFQNQGVGTSLFADAVRRTLQAAEVAGIRALAVHAKDDRVKQFYSRFDFMESPTNPLHLLVLLNDLKKATE